MIAKKVIAMQIVWEEEQEIILQFSQIRNKQKWLVLPYHFGWNRYLSGVPNKRTCKLIKSGAKKVTLCIYHISTLHWQNQCYRNRYNLINRPSGSCKVCKITKVFDLNNFLSIH